MFKPVVETNHLFNLKFNMTKPQVNILEKFKEFAKESKAGIYFNMMNLFINKEEFDQVVENLVRSLEHQDSVLNQQVKMK
jgi:tetrahydromethanopterin S-methyltransferase subunit B